jgi:hypothetical protein
VDEGIESARFRLILLITNGRRGKVAVEVLQTCMGTLIERLCNESRCYEYRAARIHTGTRIDKIEAVWGEGIDSLLVFLLGLKFIEIVCFP